MRERFGSTVAGLAVLAGAVTIAGCGESAALDTGAVSDVAEVVQRDLEILVEATGQVEPIRVVEVKSKASGEVLAMHVDTGDEVARGALLAEVDPRDVRHALAQAEADLDVARARLTIAEARTRRTLELQRANVATEQEFESAAMEEANARAQLVKAEFALELAREQMGDVTIRAPLAGTVIQRDVEAGQIIASASANISGGTTLLLMADLSEMQVRMLVDETDIGRIQPNQMARVTVDAYPDRTFDGTILKIEPKAVVEQNVTMFPVLIHLDNRERLLKPGMTAHVRVEIARRENAVAVPNAAIVGQRDMASIGSLLGIGDDVVRAAMAAPRRPAAESEADAERPADAGSNGQTALSQADCTALFQRLRGGDRSSLGDADRARLQQCREQFGGAMRAGGGRGGDGPAGMTAGGRPGARGNAVRSGEARPGLVIVKTGNGLEPRRVMLGVNDWDYTEVVEGLDPGERVVLISVARMQQQQQEMMDRMRARTAIFPSAQQSSQGGGAAQAQPARGGR